MTTFLGGFPGIGRKGSMTLGSGSATPSLFFE